MMKRRRLRQTSALVLAGMLLSSCGSGGADQTAAPAPSTPPITTASTGYPVRSVESLSIIDVEKILAQAIEEASARRLPATIAVVDRVGNVLAVYSMQGARATALTRPASNGDNSDVQI
jgi:hypothetical protein